LERVLQVESSSLARLLGYVPPSELRNSPTSVLDAVNADPRLDEDGRELLTGVYRWLVRTGRGSN
jgi:hypothetical protein